MHDNDGKRTNLRSDYQRDSYDDFLDNFVLPIFQRFGMFVDCWWERVGKGFEMDDPRYVSVLKDKE
jgi:hypothetical protein